MRFRFLIGLGTELGAAWRSLRRRPLFLAAAILTIALGIGAPVAMTGVAHEVLLEPLPYSRPAELRLVRSVLPSGDRLGFTGAEFRDFRGAMETLPVSSATAFVRPSLDEQPVRTDGDEPRALDAIRAEPAFFRMLGLDPELGAGFSAAAGTGPEIVLGHAYWRDREGADPGIVGKTMTIDGVPHRVAGVLPRGFEFPWRGETPQVWIRWEPSPALLANRDARVLGLVARLQDGADGRSLVAALEPILERSRELSPAAPPARFEAPTLHEVMVGGTRMGIVLLGAAAGVAYVIALLNLSLLIAARVRIKAPELAIRRALGGGRAAVARPLMAEALVLCVPGSLLGLVLATAGTNALLDRVPGGVPRLESLSAGPLLLACTVALALVVGLAAFLVPALRAPVSDLDALRSRSGQPPRWGGRLTAIQTAMLFLLLAVMALSVRSLEELGRVDPGFEPGGKLAVPLQLSEAHYADRRALHDALGRMERELAAVGGVETAGAITNLPLNPSSMSGTLFVQGRDNPASARPVVDWELVSPGYFRAAGIRLLRGRGIRAGDGPEGPPVTVISESLARTLAPGGDPVGMRISATGPDGPWREVVGVVNDVRQQGLTRPPRGFMYVPLAQVPIFSNYDLSVVVAPAGGNAVSLWPRIRGALRELDPEAVIGEPSALGALVTASMADARFRTTLVGIFGLTALFLGMIGLNGVIHQGVTARNREFAVRMALGASGRSVLGLILSRTQAPVLLGLALGAVATWLVLPYFEAILFGVSPRESASYGLVAILLLAASIAAALGPAARAAATHPARVLRDE